MALGTVASGSQTTTIGTEHALVTTTVAGIYVAQWNLTNLDKGDVIRLYLTAKVLASDAEEIVFESVYANDLRESPVIQSPPVLSMHSLTVRCLQSSGSSRVIPWALVRVAEY